MWFFTERGPLLGTAAVIGALNFACYAYNRQNGMSAESLARLFPKSGAAMEAHYQQRGAA